MNRKKAIGIVMALVLLGTASYYYLHYYQDNDKLLQASGTIEATTVEICARLNGTLQNLSVNEGMKIEKGQLLAELSRSDLAGKRRPRGTGSPGPL